MMEALERERARASEPTRPRRSARRRPSRDRGSVDEGSTDWGDAHARTHRSRSVSTADGEEFARSPRRASAAGASPRNAERTLSENVSAGEEDDGDDRRTLEWDVSLGTPKKRSSFRERILIQPAAWDGRDETETEGDEDNELRTHIDVVDSPLAQKLHTTLSKVGGAHDPEIEAYVGSPLPRALSRSVEVESALAAAARAEEHTSSVPALNTPDPSANGVTSSPGSVQTPWTATPDARAPVSLKPADRALSRELFQRVAECGAPGAVSARFSSPRVMRAVGESDIQYEKVATEMMETLGDECEEVCLMLEYALSLRDKWLFDDDEAPCPIVGKPNKSMDIPVKSDHEFKMVHGVVHVYRPNAKGEMELEHAPPGTATNFFHDMHALLRVQSYGPSKTFCHKRLMLTEQKFNLHVMLNADREFMEQKQAPHRDFYNVRKVDTHIHHSACMNQKHLLRFIKSKLKREPHELVIYRDGKFLNLREVFESIGMTAYELNVDTLDMHADKNTFHRFDRFNLKYNPMGQSRLREIFIKQDNLIRGRFLAELTKQVCSDLEANKYTMAEYRISIYGRKATEWDNLAAWVLNNNVFSENIVWLIQVPRLYNVYHSSGTMKNFQQMLDNIFLPLFEVTVDPSSHPKLHTFLQMVVGLDMVDDESKPERRPSKHMRTPEEWDVPYNPAYAYYAYYIYANLYTLNALRVSKGLNAIAFRPHAGEAGDIDHLCATYMLAKNIAHGLNLRKSPCLQYLYYLSQIPLDMSPLSNNSLFIDYHKNPFPQFFARGLRVALSTDDPLMIHMTKEPLVEEYSVAAQVWKLSAADLCEIAKTSVLNSGFPRASKQHWVSDEYWLGGTRGNDIQKTNVPALRAHFREDVLECERSLVRRGVVQARQKGREIQIRG